jgi:hypothetical protein
VSARRWRPCRTLGLSDRRTEVRTSFRHRQDRSDVLGVCGLRLPAPGKRTDMETAAHARFGPSNMRSFLSHEDARFCRERECRRRQRRALAFA